MNPLVSIVIPIYNRGAPVRATVDSALSQTLPSDAYEVILIDDGSTDSTPELLRHTYGHEPRVRLISQRNAGVARARNRGLQEARGEFIAYLDHDDRWLPDKLERQLAAFEGRPQVAVVYCAWHDVDIEGRLLPEEQQTARPPGWEPQEGCVYSWFIRRNGIVSMSVPLIRTAVLRAVGGFDPATVPCDDWDLWLRLARRYEFAYVPHALVLYSRHTGQQSRALALMARGSRTALLKHWPRVLHRPYLLWFVLGWCTFPMTITQYDQAKGALFAARYRDAWAVAGRVALRRPWALLSPPWVYLLRRLLIKNNAPY